MGAEEISFTRDIRPILSDHCFACHGPDEEQRQADLRLDVAAGALSGGAIVPGQPAESTVWNRITSTDPDAKMPPEESHKPLNADQLQLLQKWIEQGAEYEAHWAFAPPVRPEIPASDLPNPIDAFLQQRLAHEGLELSPLADRRTMIRRLTLDLTGLPPTPGEVEVFEQDDSPLAYERLVDDLMSRVEYGEHMARYWLDLARYADTHGLHLDNVRSMWPYRDWVVRAFQENLPFDDFTRWQLAGDLLPNRSIDQWIASGFNRCNVTTSEGGSIDDEWIYRYAVDRTTVAAEVWMGLTAGCAVCHDHKFDPLTSQDFYSMYAFFHSAADPAMDGNKLDTPPVVKLYTSHDEVVAKELEAKLANFEERFHQTVAELNYRDPADEQSPPGRQDAETLWFEDGFPRGAEVLSEGGEPTTLISSAEGQVVSGRLAIRRTATGVAQDYYQQGAANILLPADSRLFVYCYLDAANPPEAIMLQFRTDDWKHRVVWGDETKFPFGTPGTADKVVMGELPETGKWVRLEIDPGLMDLKTSSKITGFAMTQFAGTVTWDRLGVVYPVEPSTNPNWSFSTWKEENAGKVILAFPENVRQILRGRKMVDWTPEEAGQVFDAWIKNIYLGAEEQLAPLRSELANLERAKVELEQHVPMTMVMAELPQPRQSFVMLRGAYDNPGEQVTRGVPAFLPPLPAKPEDRDYNRLDFADWLVSGQHPLTARVAVNRFWQQFFGTGIVKTSADFGSQGEPPSHPELLDWLAVSFVEHGWDIQYLIKLIVTSQAYRQEAVSLPNLLAIDPENRLLARGPRARLDAEVLRDQALFLGGLLVTKVGGQGVKPYQPPDIWEPVAFGGSNTRFYTQGTGEDLYRRSLYTFLKRTAPPPYMSTFDAPNREQSCSRRERSNTPMQALQLMNDVQFFEAARNFATRILTEAVPEPGLQPSTNSPNAEELRKQRISWAWLVATCRPPSPRELQVASEMLVTFEHRYASDVEAAQSLIEFGESPVDAHLCNSELAAYTMLANLILNLDETVNN